MVDDTQYVIVPNDTAHRAGGPVGSPLYSANENGHYVAKLVKDGYRIICKLSNREAVHYVLIKFKPGSHPLRAGESPANHAIEDVLTSPDSADEPIPF